jgi:hypothetical protein
MLEGRLLHWVLSGPNPRRGSAAPEVDMVMAAIVGGGHGADAGGRPCRQARAARQQGGALVTSAPCSCEAAASGATLLPIDSGTAHFRRCRRASAAASTGSK